MRRQIETLYVIVGRIMKDRIALLLQLGVVFAAAVVPAFAGGPVITPEPASVLLVGGGIGALILLARWKRSQK
jgi:hypothetical protein